MQKDQKMALYSSLIFHIHNYRPHSLLTASQGNKATINVMLNYSKSQSYSTI